MESGQREPVLSALSHTAHLLSPLCPSGPRSPQPDTVSECFLRDSNTCCTPKAPGGARVISQEWGTSVPQSRVAVSIQESEEGGLMFSQDGSKQGNSVIKFVFL